MSKIEPYKVVIADSSIAVLRILKFNLENVAGHFGLRIQVFGCKSLDRAIKTIEAIRPDAVSSATTLPTIPGGELSDTAGMQILRYLRENGRSTPFLFYTDERYSDLIKKIPVYKGYPEPRICEKGALAARARWVSTLFYEIQFD